MRSIVLVFSFIVSIFSFTGTSVSAQSLSHQPSKINAIYLSQIDERLERVEADFESVISNLSDPSDHSEGKIIMAMTQMIEGELQLAKELRQELQEKNEIIDADTKEIGKVIEQIYLLINELS